MSRIARLPDDLVNKIAAGEVVERPASAVKELIENALDAGARTITVEVEGGGRSLIRVRDDGCGMVPADAEAAFMRHATSKLRSIEDLERVSSHGFRGEALPSIASVAHVVLTTRAEGEPAGTEVEVEYGRLVHARAAGHPRGTTVEVRDLFGAVPARRKFLRADTTEAGHVAEAVTVLALAHPEVGFTLTSARREVLRAPPVDGLAARVFQILGAGRLAELLEIEGGEEWARVRGYVTRPDRPGSARPNIRLFVNGRPVRDRAITRAVSEAYRAAGARDLHGDIVLFVEAPHHLVDVNVHPAKTEVRFASPRVVWSAVSRAVREGLSAGGHTDVRRGDTAQSGGETGAGAGQVSEAMSAWPSGAFDGGRPSSHAPRPVPFSAAAAATLLEAAPPTVLGQYRNTYLVATDGDDLILIDQHTAHERVRYEALRSARAQRAPESQMLLLPVIAHLAPRLRPAFESFREPLSAAGYEVDDFGGDAVRIAAVPAVLAGRDPAAALEHILDALLEETSVGDMAADARDRVTATLACHSAVRAGEPLKPEAMRAIVDGLWRTEQPLVCPHGRPTRARLAQEDVRRWFGRSGWRRQ